MKILTAEQTRSWDKYTITNEPVSSVELMERAAAACTTWLNKFSGKSFKIFCGVGNNGGDGLAIARMLWDKQENIAVYIVEEANKKEAPDFTINLERIKTFSIPITRLKTPGDFPVISKDDIVLDALFGSGLNRSLEGLVSDLVQHINKAKVITVAIDIPSGMPADSALESKIVIEALYTLTFQQLKLCFMYPENEPYFGEAIVLDIGLIKTFLSDIPTSYFLSDATDIKQLYKPRKAFSHKGTFGHALIIAGEKGKMGAAVLCSQACLRAGAGLVSALVPKDQFDIIQTAAPEVMAMAHQEMETIEWEEYTTIGIGPGIGTRNEGTKLLKKVLTHFNKPIVIDADGLNIISQQKELLDYVPAGSILSPHPKEFERLFGSSANQPESIEKALKHAQQYSIYIIIKGHHSVLACPSGEVFFNNTGNAGMATGGSGDVLTGLLTGLLSQKYLPKDAALLGMHLHGLAADIAVKSLSQEALIAGDILSFFGKAFLMVSNY